MSRFLQIGGKSLEPRPTPPTKVYGPPAGRVELIHARTEAHHGGGRRADRVLPVHAPASRPQVHDQKSVPNAVRAGYGSSRRMLAASRRTSRHPQPTTRPSRCGDSAAKSRSGSGGKAASCTKRRPPKERTGTRSWRADRRRSRIGAGSYTISSFLASEGGAPAKRVVESEPASWLPVPQTPAERSTLGHG